MSLCWFNGKIVAKDQARVSVFDHGLLYGDGVFEGIRFYNHRAFRLSAHLQRLQDSATAIGLTLPYSTQQLSMAVDEIMQSYAQADGYLRMVCTRGEGALGINPASCPQANLFIIADELCFVDARARQQGLRLIIASTRKTPMDSLDARIKSLNYLNHIMARREANRARADEAILLNHQGKVAEGTTDNIFIVRGNQLRTPPLTDGALAGITRAIVLSLASALDIDCRETSLTPYDLYTADECFLTGTAAELLPVREIDAHALPACPGPIFQRLQQGFGEVIQTETQTGNNAEAVA